MPWTSPETTKQLKLAVYIMNSFPFPIPPPLTDQVIYKIDSSSFLLFLEPDI
ncbi:hypothetical protein LguiB_029169 [Lonicera macranthoides]